MTDTCIYIYIHIHTCIFMFMIIYEAIKIKV